MVYALDTRGFGGFGGYGNGSYGAGGMDPFGGLGVGDDAGGLDSLQQMQMLLELAAMAQMLQQAMMVVSALLELGPEQLASMMNGGGRSPCGCDSFASRGGRGGFGLPGGGGRGGFGLPSGGGAPRGAGGPGGSAPMTNGPVPTTAPRLQQYRPGSPEARALFRDAARAAGLPESWGDSQGLHNILARESNGQVGRPNYTYGARARNPEAWGSVHDEIRNGVRSTRSTATGLGQLLVSNVDRYYPSGRRGIGDPMEEAVGMLRYIKDRYGTPENAWAQYGRRHEGY